MKSTPSSTHLEQTSQSISHDYLEFAHVVGQRHVLPHIRTHWLMLKICLRCRSIPEVFGQGIHLVLGALGYAIGVAQSAIQVAPLLAW
ncbi:MAG: DUF3703 domain-containing protein [Cytophagaceae bacterium]|nr:MAG: DUF3703 domain-containing protein [Cytophagaceae bacterium]